MASASGVRAGRAYVELGADGSALEKGLKQAEARLKAFGKSVGAIGAAIQGIGAAIQGPLLGAAKKFADAGSALNDMSARTGVSVEALSALGYAANQSGTDLETVEGAMRKMAKALQAGSEENLAAEASFAALGLSVQALEQLSPEDQFNAVARAIGAIPDPTSRAAAAMTVFGKSGTALLPMIADLDSLTAEAKAFGLVWTGEEAKKADALGDAFDLLKASIGRVVTAVGGELAPLLTDVAVALARGAKMAIDWVKANGPLIVSIFKFSVAVIAVGGAITGLGIAIYGAGAAFGFLATVVGLLLNPIVGTILALGGLVAAFLLTTDTGGAALAWLGDRFHDLTADAVSAFGGIADALKAGDISLAAQILWAEIKVEWIKGTNYLGGITRDALDYVYGVFDKFRFGFAADLTDWMTNIKAIFVIGWHGVAGIFESAWAAIKGGFYAFTNGFMSYFDSFSSGFVGALITMVGEIRKEMAIAKGFLTLSDSSKAVDAINQETEQKRADFEKGIKDRAAARDKAAAAVPVDAAKAAKDREAKKQDELAKIGQGNLDAHAALKDQKDAAAEARKKAALDAADAAGDALHNAQGTLDDLVGQAKDKAANLAGAAPRSPDRPDGELTPGGLDQTIEQTKAKVSVSGSFSSAAVGGLGAGDTVGEKQLDEQKKTNGHLEKLTKKVDQKQAAFA